jgi:hypothetical protein
MPGKSKPATLSNVVPAPVARTQFGRIHFPGAFTTVNRSGSGGGGGWLDNDPHFWNSPPWRI